MSDSKQRTPSRRPTAPAPGKRSPAPGQPRRLSKKQLEDIRQLRLRIAIGSGVALVVLVLLGSFLYDQVLYPSQAVASVGSATLNRTDLWAEQRSKLTAQIVQNMQYLRLLGGNQQFSAQFAGQSPTIEQQILTVRNLPPDPSIVQDWIDKQIIMQGAERDFGIKLSQAEIDQTIAGELGAVFIPPAPTTPTVSLTPTAIISPAQAGISTSQVLTIPVPPVITAPIALEPTRVLTPTTRPTPQLDAAASELDKIADAVFTDYSTEMENVSKQPRLTRDDFKQSLRLFFVRRVLEERVSERLVPTNTFTPTTKPEQVEARQIFLRVDVPITASAEVKNAAFQARQAEADALRAQLVAGADFATLAKERSEDAGSRANGGDMGTISTKDGSVQSAGSQQDPNAPPPTIYPPEIVSTTLELQGMDISQPVRTEFGWHILQVTKRTVQERDAQLQQSRREAFDKWVEKERAAAQIQHFPAQTVTPTASAEPTTPPLYAPGPPLVPTQPSLDALTPTAITLPTSSTLTTTNVTTGTSPLSPTLPISTTLPPITATTPLSPTLPTTSTLTGTLPVTR